MRPLLQWQRQTKILRNMGGLFIASYLTKYLPGLIKNAHEIDGANNKIYKEKTMFINRLIKNIILLGLFLPLVGQAALIDLRGDLNPANQNGSDPSVVNDPNGIVPTNASGSINLLLDTDSNTLDFNLKVDGISTSDLRNFGSNATPIHLHLAGGGNSGNFGPISVDLSLGANTTDFNDTSTGFEFSRDDVSILLNDGKKGTDLFIALSVPFLHQVLDFFLS